MVVAIIDTDRFLTTKAAAQRLKLSLASVRRYLNNGLSEDPKDRPKLYGESFGRDWMIPVEEIERYEKERQPVGRQPQQKN
jgi:hypothetical protein